MKGIFLSIVTLIAASLVFTSCGAPAANNAAGNNANKAANAANTAAAPADKAAIEGEIKKTMEEFAAALNKGDADGLAKFYTDDYSIVDQSGQISNKATRLEGIKSGKIKMEGLKFEDLKFKINPEGTAAIVVGHVTGKNTIDGKSEERNSMATWVVVKSKDKGWQFTSAQVTDIKPGAAAPAKADEKKADEKKSDDTKPAAPANK